MDRRVILLIAAALIAAFGTLLVFLYVHGADQRADSRYKAVTVLKAVKQIDPGETVEQAQAAGAVETATVSQQDVLPGSLSGLEPVAGQSALATIYPGEQILQAKFGTSGGGSALSLPKGMVAISVNMSDTGRVAGFVNPGDNVAIFDSGDTGGTSFTRVLLPHVQVAAVGSTTVVTKTVTDPAGAQTTEQLPKTLFTLAVNQNDAQKILYAVGHGELAFAVTNSDSQVSADPGVSDANLFR